MGDAGSRPILLGVLIACDISDSGMAFVVRQRRDWLVKVALLRFFQTWIHTHCAPQHGLVQYQVLVHMAVGRYPLLLVLLLNSDETVTDAAVICCQSLQFNSVGTCSDVVLTSSAPSQPRG